MRPPRLPTGLALPPALSARARAPPLLTPPLLALLLLAPPPPHGRAPQRLATRCRRRRVLVEVAPASRNGTVVREHSWKGLGGERTVLVASMVRKREPLLP